MKARLLGSFGAALAPLVAAAAMFSFESNASAQEILLTGPLAGQKHVKSLRLYREGRIEIAPTASFTLLDEYRRTILFGARAQYHIFDWLGVGAWGAYGAISYGTDLTDQVDTVAPRNSRTATNVNHTNTFGNASFGDQTGKMTWVFAPQATFVPFRGKLALFQKVFVDTDLYLHGGVAFVGLDERAGCGVTGQTACADPSTFKREGRVAVAPTFGLGWNFYLNKMMSVGLEYRALPFSWNRAGFDSRGGPPNGEFPDQQVTSEDRTFKFNQMVTLAVGFSFGERKLSQ